MKLKVKILRVADGFVPAIIPANATQELENAITMDAFNAILIHQKVSKKSQVDHAVRFEEMLWTQEGVSAAKIRAMTRDKRKARGFRRHIVSIKAHSMRSLFNERLSEFMRLNWQVLTMVPPKYQHFPGLKRWHPRAVLDLMKGMGFGIQPGHTVHWYKVVRQRKSLEPQQPYLITALPK